MPRFIELRRYTDSDGDVLTDEGVAAALRAADPALVAEDSARLGAALGRVLARLGEGERALVVGHSPTNEAAVLGLTGQLVAPLAKGAGVLVVAETDRFRVESLALDAELPTRTRRRTVSASNSAAWRSWARCQCA